MFYTHSLNILTQISGDMLVILTFLAMLALGISIGVLASFIYFLRIIRRNILNSTGKTESPEKYIEIINTLESKQQSLSSDVEELKTAIKTIQNNFTQFESKITTLEGRVTLLERRKIVEPTRPSAYAKPVTPLAKEKFILKDIRDISLYYPEVRYAGIITSQGYIVSSHGQSSEEPPKLLEVLRLSNMDRTSLIRSNRRIEVFRIGEVKDLTVYGILEFDNATGVDETRIEEIKETISKYFRDELSKKV